MTTQMNVTFPRRTRTRTETRKS